MALYVLWVQITSGPQALMAVRHLLVAEVARRRISPSHLASLMPFEFVDSSQVPQLCESDHEGVPPELPAQL